MNLGLLDLPAPLWNAVDDICAWAHVPAVLRVVAWASVLAWVSMRLYRRFSDQPRLLELRAEIARTQRALAVHDGGFADLRALIRQNFRLSLRQLGLTLRPAVLASLPLLFVLPWLSNRFDFEQPAVGTAVNVCAQPATAASLLRWLPKPIATSGDCWQLNWPAADAPAMLADTSGTPFYTLDNKLQSVIVHKFIWLNYLIGNPGGYLPAAAPIERLAITVPAQQMIGAGPGWMRDWETWFFTALLVVSLALKLRWRLH
jgi:hypothetical protein